MRGGILLFSKVLGLVLLVEFTIMILFAYVITTLSPITEAFIDSSLLACTLTPFFWHWLVTRDRHRMAVENELRISNEMANQACEKLENFIAATNAFAIVSVTDSKGVIIQTNELFTQITGYTQEELIGQTHRIINSGVHSREFFTEMWRTISSGKVWKGEICNRKKNGDLYYVDSMIMPVAGSDGKPFQYISIRYEVTDRILVARELKELAREAQLGAQAKAEFLANMSHEIRTPMNAVIGMTGLLLDTKLTAEQLEFTETIRKGGDQLLSLINDILDFSKIESGNLDLESGVVDLRECAESTLDLLASSAAQKNLDLLLMIQPDVPLSILGDVTRLRQIIVNLISNGVKFTEKGEVVLSLSVRKDDTLPSRQLYLKVEVSDTGIGIPLESRERLFKVFSQVDTSTTRKFGGTGLGLAISLRLVELMGGRIWVESETGRGSTFIFEIPVEPVAPAPKLQPVHLNFGEKKILIIDDSATNRRILSLQFESWGLIPFAASSGSEAMEWINRGDQFDLLVLDYQMPEADGLDVIRDIRKILPAEQLPAIMLTSIGSIPVPSEFGISCVLSKPVKSLALYNSVQSLFTSKTKGPELKPHSDEMIPRLGEELPFHILIAEDNLINQKVAQMTLNKLGYRPDIVSNGLEALEAVFRQKYDVLFLDIQMPQMDGIEVARRLCAKMTERERPVLIAITAHAMMGDKEKFLEIGMDDYISKPVSVASFIATLHKANKLLEQRSRMS